jgi:hypothetical protein
MEQEHARACPPPPEGKPSFWWAVNSEPWKRADDITGGSAPAAEPADVGSDRRSGRDGREAFLRRVGRVAPVLPVLSTAPQGVENARVAAAIDRECRSLGVAPGTAGYVQCRTTLLQARAMAQQQADAAMLAEWISGLDNWAKPVPVNDARAAPSVQSRR